MLAFSSNALVLIETFGDIPVVFSSVYSPIALTIDACIKKASASVKSNLSEYIWPGRSCVCLAWPTSCAKVSITSVTDPFLSAINCICVFFCSQQYPEAISSTSEGHSLFGNTDGI